MNKIHINDKDYSVAVNWNAIISFLEATGDDSMEAFSHLGEIKPSELTTLMSKCIEEGERLEGRKTVWDPRELGEVVDMEDMARFVNIFTHATIMQKKKEM